MTNRKLETIRNIVGIATIVFALVAIFAGIMAAITGCESVSTPKAVPVWNDKYLIPCLAQGGPGVPAAAGVCIFYDRDGDGDVDLRDYAIITSSN